jgi:epoxyqueuosine reductase
MLSRLEELASYIAAESGTGVKHRSYVDTGPILERAFACAAGLGFIGKNTNLIHPKLGSYLFLGEILVDTLLDPTPNTSHVHCGTCRRCLDACPTGALVAPYVVDARRCVSYLTIELKGTIPRDLRPGMDNWIYGCDICQEVCPWQRFAQPTAEAAFLARDGDRAQPRLVDLARIDQHSFATTYDGSPIARIGRSRLLRNVAIALGNWGEEQALAPLEELFGDPDPLVRSHAAWALGRVEGNLGQKVLENSVRHESIPSVGAEIRQALENSLTSL